MKHKYTINIDKSLYSEEFFKLYCRWYTARFEKNDLKQEDVLNYCFNSPIYDSNKDPKVKFNHSSDSKFKIDKKFREGFPTPGFGGFGTYNIYHRIDGKLIAVGVVDIVKTKMVN